VQSDGAGFLARCPLEMVRKWTVWSVPGRVSHLTLAGARQLIAWAQQLICAGNEKLKNQRCDGEAGSGGETGRGGEASREERWLK